MPYQFKSNLAEQAKKLEKKYKNNIANVLGKMATAYSAKALQYVPPGMTNKKARLSGKKINPKLYKRKYVYLPQSVRDSKNRIAKKDAEFLHKNFFYRLISTVRLNSNHGIEYRTNKGVIYGYYFKTLRALKKWIKIQNRGLLKAMFGANLGSIGQVVPNVIKSLMSKSKNLFNLIGLNELKYSQGKDTLKITNKFKDKLTNQSFFGIAVREGQKQAQKTLKKEMKKITEKEQKI